MSNDGTDTVSTEETMRARSDESRVKLRLLLETDRVIVTGILALLVFVGFMLFSVFLSPSVLDQPTSTDTIDTLFSSMIGVLVTGTTFVVTINQIVLSQENGPLGDQRNRMSGSMEFRMNAKDLIGGVVPADPSAFLRELVAAAERRSEALVRVVEESDNSALTEQVTEFVDSVHGNAQQVESQLDGAQFGTFDVLFAALNFNYSWKIFQVERMTAEFEDLDEDQEMAFDDLRTALTMFGTAREHIKTLYFQWALVELSQYILYIAVPALVVAAGVLAFVNASTFGPATFLDIPVVTWVVAVAFTTTTTPFLLFTAYILRIATVAKRTLAIGPLILRESQE